MAENPEAVVANFIGHFDELLILAERHDWTYDKLFASISQTPAAREA